MVYANKPTASVNRHARRCQRSLATRETIHQRAGSARGYGDKQSAPHRDDGRRTNDNPLLSSPSADSVSEKCLQPINNSTTPGDAIVLLPCDPKNTAQVWIQTASSCKVHFINYNSKLCLDARGGAAAGTPIQQ